MNAEIARISLDQSSVIDRTHPPVLGAIEVAVDDTLEEGLILAKDATGKAVAYDPAGLAPVNKPIGVLVNDCDTTKDDAAVYLKHGTVVAASLKVGAGTPDADDLAALEAISIYAK